MYAREAIIASNIGVMSAPREFRIGRVFGMESRAMRGNRLRKSSHVVGGRCLVDGWLPGVLEGLREMI
eukprot:1391526-Amorphochlora_amoeboformis.AAC.2